MSNIDAVIEKIKKAVRLANRTTEGGERETALRLARSLAERNGLAFDEIEGDANADAAVMREDEEFSKEAGGSEFGCSCYILHRHFSVILMLKRDRPTRKCRFAWFGSPLNIDIARHVHHILMRESRRAWREFKKEAAANGGGEEAKRESFMRGFFWQVSVRLTDCPLRNDADIAADTKRAERRLLAFRQENEVRESRRNVRKLDAGSFCGGVGAAKSLNLARPCEGRETARRGTLADEARPALALAEGGAA